MLFADETENTVLGWSGLRGDISCGGVEKDY